MDTSPSALEARKKAYKDTEPDHLQQYSGEIPEQTIFYPPHVPMDELTHDQLFLGGSNLFKILPELIQRVRRLESDLQELKDLVYSRSSQGTARAESESVGDR